MMADPQESLRNWLVAQRGDEFKVFARLEWDQIGAEEWTMVKKHLTEQEAIAEMTRLAPPEKRD
jgi:hypothetical protein